MSYLDQLFNLGVEEEGEVTMVSIRHASGPMRIDIDDAWTPPF